MSIYVWANIIVVGTSIYDSSGTYYDTLISNNGCDSIVTTNLAILPKSDTTFDFTLCPGESVLIGTSIYTSSGLYYDTLINSNGCDSVVFSKVTMTSADIDTNTFSICIGDSLFAGGSYQDSSGTFIDSFLTTGGCDSIIVTDLTVSDSYVASTRVLICDGDSVYIGGAFQTIPRIYYDTTISPTGCDSVLATELVIKPNPRDTLHIEICDGERFNVGPSSYSTSGTYVDTLAASNGCDSIVITNLSVLPHYLDSLFISSCNTPLGWIYDTLFSTGGCDSIVITRLLPLISYSDTFKTTICRGDSTYAEGAYQNLPGLYTDSFISVDGCDSLVTIDLNVLESYTIADSLTICEGDVYFAGGAWQDSTGTYFDTFNTQNNCDSIVITMLYVLPSYTDTIKKGVCEGDSIVIGDSTYSSTGVYFNTFMASNSCDSTIILVLTVLQSHDTVIAFNICPGDSIVIGSNVYDSPGLFRDTFIRTNGCDSIVTTNLSILNEPTDTFDFTLCYGESIVIGGQEYDTTGVYLDTTTASAGCDSISVIRVSSLIQIISLQTPEICEGDSVDIGSSVYSTTGNYKDTFSSVEGCDSVVSTLLTVHPTFSTLLSPTICEGESHFAQGSYQTVAGDYYDTFSSLQGCDSIIITQLTVIESEMSSSDYAICEGDSFWVGNVPYTLPGIYYDTVVASNGCDSIIESILSVVVSTPENPCDSVFNPDNPCEKYFDVPNAFTPNGDLLNDEFMVLHNGINKFRLLVFDRWGTQMFETSDPEEGWDGYYKGRLQDPGAYVYYVDLEFCDGKILPKNHPKRKGSVTLIR